MFSKLAFDLQHVSNSLVPAVGLDSQSTSAAILEFVDQVRVSRVDHLVHIQSHMPHSVTNSLYRVVRVAIVDNFLFVQDFIRRQGIEHPFIDDLIKHAHVGMRYICQKLQSLIGAHVDFVKPCLQMRRKVIICKQSSRRRLC